MLEDAGRLSVRWWKLLRSLTRLQTSVNDGAETYGDVGCSLVCFAIAQF